MHCSHASKRSENCEEMVRVPCCEKMAMKKGPWTPEEDHILISFIHQYGHENWRALPKLAGLMRCGKSCRLRWTNYLRPDIKRGNFTSQEEDVIIDLHRILGNRWSAIANRLPGRTDNEIKNYWNTHLKKTRAREHHLQGPTSFDHQSLSSAGSLDYRIYAPRRSFQEDLSDPGKNIVASGDSGRLQKSSSNNNINDGDSSSDDMVFWYNIFVNSGTDHPSIQTS